MTGYYIHPIDGDAFGKLVSTPIDHQSRVFAEFPASGYAKELEPPSASRISATFLEGRSKRAKGEIIVNVGRHF